MILRVATPTDPEGKVAKMLLILAVGGKEMTYQMAKNA
jgi:hypothetical protein